MAKRYEYEYRVKGPSGEWRIVNSQAAILKDDHGKPIKMSGLAMDISEHKQAQEALRASEENLHLIIDTSPIGICTVDLLGNFVMTNAAYEKMLGYTKEDLTKLSFFDVTHPDNRPKNKKLFQSMFSLKTTTFFMEKRYIRKDGAMIEVAVNATGIMDAEGNVRFGTAFVEDITERKQAEDELKKAHEDLEIKIKERTENLRHANEDLSQYAHVVSHDLKAPLRAIRNYSDFLVKYFRCSKDSTPVVNLRVQELAWQSLKKR